MHHFPRCLFSTRCERHNKRPQRMVCYFLLQCYHMFNCSPITIFIFMRINSHTRVLIHTRCSSHTTLTPPSARTNCWNGIGIDLLRRIPRIHVVFFFSITRNGITQFWRINVKKPKGKSFFRSHKTDSEKERWRNAIEQEKKNKWKHDFSCLLLVLPQFRWIVRALHPVNWSIHCSSFHRTVSQESSFSIDSNGCFVCLLHNKNKMGNFYVV